MRQTFITYTIKDTAALVAIEGNLLGSKFRFLKRFGPNALWSETLVVQVREGTGDEEAVMAIVERHAPTANLVSRGILAEPIEGYRDGLA